MAVPYQNPRGTRAGLNALAAANNIKPGQVYLITDEQRLAVGLTVSTYEAFAKMGEGGSVGTYSYNSTTNNGTAGSVPAFIGANYVATADQLFLNAQGVWATPPSGSAFTGGTLTSKLTTATSSTSTAGLRIPHGTAPTSPVNGDLWSTTAGFYGRVNGVTIGPFGAGGGGSDPWTRSKLASDFVNGTTTFNTVPEFTFTPPANSDWIMEAYLLVQTTATASLPRIGLNVVAGQAYGSVMMEFPGSTTAKTTTNGWWTTSLANIQMPVGTAPVAGQPYLVYLYAAGRSGASPTAINIQLAAETAGTNAAIIKAGSHMRYMVIP